jgi:hypothetical protein
VAETVVVAPPVSALLLFVAEIAEQVAVELAAVAAVRAQVKNRPLAKYHSQVKNLHSIANYPCPHYTACV